MSTDGSDSGAARPTIECTKCQMYVPAGEFCGWCGGHLSDGMHRGPRWLRMKSYSATAGEHLLRPNVVSSLFPQLSAGSRLPFTVGLGLVVAVLVAATLFRLPGVLVTVAALGLPLLFLIYLQESESHRDIPSATLVVTAALGIGLGVGWVLVTGAMMARSYGVPFGTGITSTRIVRDGLGVPVGGMIVMLVPVALARLWRRDDQEALDGFGLGALGALMFTGAATLTRLAPQFADGMVAQGLPMAGLMVEAGIRGIAVPITAASVGGLIGTALWFDRPADRKRESRNYVRAAIAVLGAAVLGIYASIGLIDVAQVLQFWQLAVHLTIAAFALLMLRVGLHLALLHEAHDDVQIDEPMLCTECGHVVPDMPFCVACGAAMRSSSRSSRRNRRDNRPVHVDPEADR